MDIVRTFEGLGLTGSVTINIQGTSDDPLFQVDQVGKALGLADFRAAIKALDDDEVIVGEGVGVPAFLTWSGILGLCCWSSAPNARLFYKWVWRALKDIRVIERNEMQAKIEMDEVVSPGEAKETTQTAIDFGGAILRPVSDAGWFWALFDEMVADGGGFANNRDILLDFYKAGRMLALEVTETDAMFEDRAARRHPWFMRRTGWYRLPAFCCITSYGAISIIWVHSRCRGAGLGRLMVEQTTADEEGVSEVLPESVGFWERCGVSVLSLAYVPKTTVTRLDSA
jgi:GNAT superfamily N-acetyltransferase